MALLKHVLRGGIFPLHRQGAGAHVVVLAVVLASHQQSVGTVGIGDQQQLGQQLGVAHGVQRLGRRQPEGRLHGVQRGDGLRPHVAVHGDVLPEGHQRLLNALRRIALAALLYHLARQQTVVGGPVNRVVQRVEHVVQQVFAHPAELGGIGQPQGCPLPRQLRQRIERLVGQQRVILPGPRAVVLIDEVKGPHPRLSRHARHGDVHRRERAVVAEAIQRQAAHGRADLRLLQHAVHHVEAQRQIPRTVRGRGPVQRRRRRFACGEEHGLDVQIAVRRGHIAIILVLDLIGDFLRLGRFLLLGHRRLGEGLLLRLHGHLPVPEPDGDHRADGEAGIDCVVAVTGHLAVPVHRRDVLLVSARRAQHPEARPGVAGGAAAVIHAPLGGTGDALGVGVEVRQRLLRAHEPHPVLGVVAGVGAVFGVGVGGDGCEHELLPLPGREGLLHEFPVEPRPQGTGLPGHTPVFVVEGLLPQHVQADQLHRLRVALQHQPLQRLQAVVEVVVLLPVAEGHDVPVDHLMDGRGLRGGFGRRLQCWFRGRLGSGLRGGHRRGLGRVLIIAHKAQRDRDVGLTLHVVRVLLGGAEGRRSPIAQHQVVVLEREVVGVAVGQEGDRPIRAGVVIPQYGDRRQVEGHRRGLPEQRGHVHVRIQTAVRAEGQVGAPGFMQVQRRGDVQPVDHRAVPPAVRAHLHQPPAPRQPLGDFPARLLADGVAVLPDQRLGLGLVVGVHPDLVRQRVPLEGEVERPAHGGVDVVGPDRLVSEVRHRPGRHHPAVRADAQRIAEALHGHRQLPFLDPHALQRQVVGVALHRHVHGACGGQGGQGEQYREYRHHRKQPFHETNLLMMFNTIIVKNRMKKVGRLPTPPWSARFFPIKKTTGAAGGFRGMV